MSAPDRFRFLRIILTQPHRYRRYRTATMGVTLAVLFAVPLSGLARIDLWGGQHRVLGRPVDPVVGLVAVITTIAGFYVVTFLVNLPAGRMFCGFGCPVGQLSRFADAIDAFAKDPVRRRRAWLQLVAFAAALALATALWWVAPGAFAAPRSGMAVWTAALLTTGYAVFHARHWRWAFCRKLCPIGLYYSVVQTNALVGVHFAPHATCTDCEGCAAICPVGLDPRQLALPIPSPGGLAFADLPAISHCLHCGACIEVCEHLTRKAGGPAAMGFR